MLQQEIEEILIKNLPSDTLWNVWIEITNDLSFKHWKPFNVDVKTRDILCLMELHLATHRRFLTEDDTTKEFLKFAMLTIDRVMLKAQREIGMSDDKCKELYIDITTN